MRITITIAEDTLYANGRALQRMEPGELVTLESKQSDYKITVYRKLNKDRKIIRLSEHKEAQP